MRVRQHLAGDLDAPRALEEVDGWAAAVSAGAPASGLVPTVVDALLGVELG